MTIEEFKTALSHINNMFTLDVVNGKPKKIVFVDEISKNVVPIYNFEEDRFLLENINDELYSDEFNGLVKLLFKYKYALRKQLDEYIDGGFDDWDFDALEADLHEKVNEDLTIYFDQYSGLPEKLKYETKDDSFTIYSFKDREYNIENCAKFIHCEMPALTPFIDKYWNGGYAVRSTKSEGNQANPFKKYTDDLAETLWTKNKAYGDSFSSAIDDFGLKAAGTQLSHKYNRMKHLVNANKLTENGESLEDTMLDLAGYSILTLRYLKEHENE